MRHLAVAYFTLHVVALITFCFPRGYFMPARRIFGPYIDQIAHYQKWTMFAHREIWRQMSIALVVEDKGGQQKEFGPVLPELTHSGEQNLRVKKLLNALALGHPNFELRTKNYIENICRRLRDERFDPLKISMKLHGESIVPIELTYSGAEPFQKVETSRGPFLCN